MKDLINKLKSERPHTFEAIRGIIIFLIVLYLTAYAISFMSKDDWHYAPTFFIFILSWFGSGIYAFSKACDAFEKELLERPNQW